MNTGSDQFEVDGEGSDRSPAERDDTPSGHRAPRTERKRTVGRRPQRRTARRTEPVTTSADTMNGGVPFVFAPAVWFFLGALLLTALWLGGLNPTWGVHERAWPWQFLQGGFAWNPSMVFALTVGFFAAFYLVLTFTPRGPGRAIAALTVVGLGLVSFPPQPNAVLPYMNIVVLGVLGGGLLAREGIRGGAGGRALVFVGLLLAAIALFFPIAPVPEVYGSQALGLWGDIRSAMDPEIEHLTLERVLLAPANLVLMSLIVLLVLGLLSWLGAGGRWIMWVGGIVTLVGVLGPLILTVRPFLAEAMQFEGADKALAWRHGLTEGWLHLAGTLTAFALPLAAALMDAARPRDG